MDALRAPPVRFFDFAVVDFLLFVEADFDLLEALPLLRFAIVDFFELDFFAPPPPLFFLVPLLFIPARFFVPADFAMKPPSGDVGDNTITRSPAQLCRFRDIFLAVADGLPLEVFQVALQVTGGLEAGEDQ
jgi:hypothetical protein